MALSGVLLADFSDFTRACATATVSLKDFGTTGIDVAKELSTVSDSLSGVKIVQAATLAAEAVDRLGGVSKLTEAELEKVGQTATEAAAKLTAMGQTVPPGIQRIADAVKEGSTATEGWLPMLSAMGNSWVARVAEGALLRDAVHWIIDEVKDLALALPEMALKGAAVNDVEENFERLTSQAGLLGETLMGTLRAGTHDTITNFELMKAVNRDLAAGMVLTDSQFGTLAKGAFALAQATGTDVKAAFDRMNDAMLTGRTRSLAELTGKIETTAAEEKFAAAVGHSADQLTEKGKIEALRGAILDAVTESTRRLGEQTDGLDEHVAQVSVSWQNFTEDLGKAIAKSQSLSVAFDGARQMLIDTFGGSQKTLIEAIAQAVDRATIEIIDLGTSGVRVAGFMATEWYALKKVFGDVVQGVEITSLAVEKVSLAMANVNKVMAIGETANAKAAAQQAEAQKHIDELTASILKRADALAEDDQKQQQVGATTDAWVAKMGVLRSTVEAASHSSSEFVGPINQVNEGLTQQGAAAGTASEGLFKLNAEQIAAAKAYAQAVENLSAVGVTWQQTLAQINPGLVEDIKQMLAAGAAAHDLAVAWGIPLPIMKAVELSMKDDAKAAKDMVDQMAEVQKASDEYYKTVNAASHDSTQRQIDDAYLTASTRVAQLQKTAAYSVEAEMLIWKTAEQTADNIIQKTLESDVHSKAHYELLADQAKTAYEFALAHADQYTSGWITQLQKAADEAKKAADTFGTAFHDNLKQTDDDIENTIGGLHRLAMATAAATVPQGATSPYPDTVEGRLKMLEDQRARNPTIPINTSGLFAGLPLVQSRDVGGPVVAGESYLIGGNRAPEIFTPGATGFVTPTSATPLSGGGGIGGVQVTNIFNIVDTEANITRRVSDNITRSIMQAQKL